LSRHAEELEGYKKQLQKERRKAEEERERAERSECALKEKDTEFCELRETLKERDEECTGLKEAASRRGEELEKESNSKQVGRNLCILLNFIVLDFWTLFL
jgi:hypothetical protein